MILNRKPLRQLCTLLLLATFAAAVGGCSTVAGLGGIPRPGYQSDGSYVLTS